MIDAVCYHNALPDVNAAPYRPCNAGHYYPVRAAVAYKRHCAEGCVYLADAAEYGGYLVSAEYTVRALHAVNKRALAAESCPVRLKLGRTCAKNAYLHYSTSHGSSTTA